MTTISVVPNYIYFAPNKLTSTTTITVPTNALSMTVKLWGAGGSGASGTSATFLGGGGGFAIKTVSVSAGQTFVVTIGQAKNGGIGQTAGTLISGSGGGMSMLHSLVSTTYTVLAVAAGGGGAGSGTGGGNGGAAGVDGSPSNNNIETTGGYFGNNGIGGIGGQGGVGGEFIINGGSGTNFVSVVTGTLTGFGGSGGTGAFQNTASPYAAGNGGDGYGGGGGGGGIFSGVSSAGGGAGGGSFGDSISIGFGQTPGNISDAYFPGTNFAYGGAVSSIGKPGYAVVIFSSLSTTLGDNVSTNTFSFIPSATFSVDRISALTNDLRIRPTNTGQTVYIGHDLSACTVTVNAGVTTSPAFIVNGLINGSNNGLLTIGPTAVTTYHLNGSNILDDGSGNININGNITAKATYNIGTISQSGSTVSGSGTNFTSSMVGGIITYSTGETAQILLVNSISSLSVTPSQTISSTTYSLSFGKIYADQIIGQQAGEYGTGIDGSITVTGTQTLTRDMYYTSLTVPLSSTIISNSYRIFVKDTLTLNGIIHNNGGAGADAIIGTAIGGAAGGNPTGNASTTRTIGYGSAGGNSINGTAGQTADSINNCCGGLGGNGGSSVSYLSISNTSTFTSVLSIDGGTVILNSLTSALQGRTLSNNRINGGSGGGGGNSFINSGSGTISGGSGGGGGGVVIVAAKNVTGTGSITANGGTGGNGSSIGLQYSGGGGGGGGGVVVLITNTHNSTINLSAAAGARGVQLINSNYNGFAGNIGKVITIYN